MSKSYNKGRGLTAHNSQKKSKDIKKESTNFNQHNEKAAQK